MGSLPWLLLSPALILIKNKAITFNMFCGRSEQNCRSDGADLWWELNSIVHAAASSVVNFHNYTKTVNLFSCDMWSVSLLTVKRRGFTTQNIQQNVHTYKKEM